MNPNVVHVVHVSNDSFEKILGERRTPQIVKIWMISFYVLDYGIDEKMNKE